MATQDIKLWPARDAASTDKVLVDGGSAGAKVDPGSLYLRGKAATQTLFDELSTNPFVKNIFYPHNQGNRNILNMFAAYGTYKENADGVGYLSKSLFTTGSSITFYGSSFSQVISTIDDTDNSYGLSVVSIIYWDGSAAESIRYIGGGSYNAGPKINVANGYVSAEINGSSTSVSAKFQVSDLVIGYNIIVSVVESYRKDGYLQSISGDNYISLYLNGVLKNTEQLQSGGAPGGTTLSMTTNTDAIVSSLYDDTQLLCYFCIDGRLTEVEQLEYFNKFKTDHGIA